MFYGSFIPSLTYLVDATYETKNDQVCGGFLWFATSLIRGNSKTEMPFKRYVVGCLAVRDYMATSKTDISFLLRPLRFTNGENTVRNVFTFQTHYVFIVFTTLADLSPLLTMRIICLLIDEEAEDSVDSLYTTSNGTTMNTIFHYDFSFVNASASTCTGTASLAAEVLADDVTFTPLSYTFDLLVSYAAGSRRNPHRPPPFAISTPLRPTSLTRPPKPPYLTCSPPLPEKIHTALLRCPSPLAA